MSWIVLEKDCNFAKIIFLNMEKEKSISSSLFQFNMRAVFEHLEKASGEQQYYEISKILKKTTLSMQVVFSEIEEPSQSVESMRLSLSAAGIYRLNRDLEQYEEATMKAPSLDFVLLYPSAVTDQEIRTRDLEPSFRNFLQSQPFLTELDKTTYFQKVEDHFQYLIQQESDTAESKLLYDTLQHIKNRQQPLPVFIHEQHQALEARLLHWLKQIDIVLQNPQQRIRMLNEAFCQYCNSKIGQEI